MPITKIDILAKLNIVKDNIKEKIKESMKDVDVGGGGGAGGGEVPDKNGGGDATGIVEGLRGQLKEMSERIEKAVDPQALKGMIKEKMDIQNKLGKATGAKTSKGFSGMMAGLLPLAMLMGLQPIQDALKLIMGFAGLGIMVLFKLFSWIITSIPEWFGKLWKSISSLPGQIWEWMKGIGKVIWDYMKDLGKTIWDFFKTAFENIKTWFIELPGKIWEFIKGLGKIIWDFMKDIGKVIWDWIKIGFEWIKEIMSIIKEKITLLWEVIKELGTKIWDWIKKVWTEISALPLKIWNWMKLLPEKIWSWIKTGFEWVRDKVSSVWDAIKSLPEWIWNKMKGLGSIISNAIGNLNPLKMFSKGDDFIVTDRGEVIKANPNDTIIATQGGMPNMGGGETKIFNFYGVTPQEMLDVMKRELQTDTFSYGRF